MRRTSSTQSNLEQAKNRSAPYEQIAGSLRSDIEDHARAIRGLLEDTTKNVIQIGLRLQFVRNRVGRDHFQDWLRSEFHWTQPVASNYMAAAREFSDLDCIGAFRPSALFVLARKNVPQAARDEAVASAKIGEQITKSRAIAIVSNHRDGQSPGKTAQHVRRYVKNLLKNLPEESTPEFISELLCLVEELRKNIATTDGDMAYEAAEPLEN